MPQLGLYLVDAALGLGILTPVARSRPSGGSRRNTAQNDVLRRRPPCTPPRVPSYLEPLPLEHLNGESLRPAENIGKLYNHPAMIDGYGTQVENLTFNRVYLSPYELKTCKLTGSCVLPSLATCLGPISLWKAKSLPLL